MKLGGFAVPVMTRSHSGCWRGSCMDDVIIGFLVDTELNAFWDFFVRLGNHAGALFLPIWLGGMVGVVWLHC